MELANLLITAYVEEKGTLEIVSPFGGVIKFGKFNNAEGAPLQLKCFTSEEDHPGSATGSSIKWPDYSTFGRILDDIDRIDVRDYSEYEMKDEELQKLREDGLKTMNDYDDGTIDEKEVRKRAKIIFEHGVGRKILARQILNCMTYIPDIDEEIKLDEIPNILSEIMCRDGVENEVFDEHETDQVRAAGMMFGVAICEAFRTNGALKHIRQCLRVIEKEGMQFTSVFGNSKDSSVCFLSPKDGTARTRKVFNEGLSKDDIEKRGWDLSDSSDDEMPKSQSVYVKKIVKAKQDEKKLKK